MTDIDPLEFDNELLSAYLDDELEQGQRARVEERLASDAGARRLLEQLRGVSRAIRDLPEQKFGDDLRDRVIQRGEQIKAAALPASASDGKSVTTAGTPRITIGRSRRAWVWAGLTVAAALLLMVYQSE
jgi:hypothetical protein